MCETMSSHEEEREKATSIATQVMIHVGDARNLIMEVLDHTAGELYDQTEDRLREAREELRQAYIFQIGVVQSEAGRKKYEYSFLSAYAQDTVMIICTEMDLAKKITSMYRKPDDKISKLEEKAEV